MRIFLSLGSNRGNRRQYLDDAIAALPGVGIRVLRVSPGIVTRPQGMSARARFLNCVVEAETSLRPQRLLHRLRLIERAAGRHRGGQYRQPAPRGLDLDILFYGRLRLCTAGLSLPHPRYAGRRFVLHGLNHLAPAWVPPGSALSVRRIWLGAKG